jgi:formylglycine-generating enzyme required for sulfatase activity
VLRAAILLTLAVALCPAASFAAAHRSTKVIRDCPECPELVRIAPGAFTMGAEGGEEGRPEGPPHPVRIVHGFLAGRYEVTNAEFAAFVAATGYQAAQGCNNWDPAIANLRRMPELSWRDPGYGRAPKPEEPVVCVAWKDARAYVDWLAKRTGKPYRLLSEAEWEYIARAGSTSRYPWGEDPEAACKYANVLDASAARIPGPSPDVHCTDGFPGVAPVGRFAPNAFGLYDVIGNAWEWVEDCYRAPYPADAPVDGSALEVEGPCDRRAVRGGSWRTIVYRQRPSWRGRDDPENMVTNIFGLRVARGE